MTSSPPQDTRAAAVEAAAKELRSDYATQYDDTNVNWQDFALPAEAALARAVPLVLDEIEKRIERHLPHPDDPHPSAPTIRSTLDVALWEICNFRESNGWSS